MWKFLLISFVALVVVQHVLTFLYIMGYHKYVYKHRPGECRIINGTDYAVEDMELTSNGIVLIAAALLHGRHRVGRIFAVNASSPRDGQTRVHITGRPSGPFHPVGLSSFQNTSSGKISVFVVNWGEIRDCIEIFEFSDNDDKFTLKFVQRKQDLSMQSISDVLAVGPDQFYFTNEAQNKHPTARMFEHYMMFPWGGVVLCSEEECKRVSNPLFEPSSIQLSPGGKYLFVSLLHGMAVVVYARDPSNSSLLAQASRSVSLGSLVDSVFVDNKGDLWMATHPVAYKYQAGQRDRRKTVPSQVLHIKFRPGLSPLKSSLEVSEVYSDDGSQLSSSSSVISHQNSLLIGSKRAGILQCEVQVVF